MGDVLQAEAVAPAADEAGIWPGELDEQLISDLLSDDSLLAPVVDPADDSEQHYCPRDNTGSGAATAAVPPAEAGRSLCSVYSGPTITDIQKALSSRPHPPRYGRRYSSLYLYGAASAAPESRRTATVRSCGGKMPTDGYKWRKYGQKSIKNNPHPRSYYKCTSSRCSAKKHVEKSTHDPEMFTVTYEGLHLHGPQPLSRHLQPPPGPTTTDVAVVNKKARLSPNSDDNHGDDDSGAGIGCGARWPSKETCGVDDDDDVGGGGSSKLQGRQKGRAHDAVIAVDSSDGRWSAASSVPHADDAAAAVFSSDPPPAANWYCLDLPWSPEGHFPWTI
ncbi:probable WRKY transcription factor 20 isoform X2 [Brachypodium distachyon]|uniref:WRKY domain-containing protein n=1 Tax=Brachypodium distachyon TaxID=15368 RepID=A0A0Q3JDS1_BRADI|nr:probable WRKY transcription factor 20 isoform X2 [Brachypodium distachyon]KQK10532.1 hypothetical protein BRADI_2g54720v3 [Brachypodium distachyon]|eukprot:XP_010232546.1 probable WRKY transcription factor 20 isoform X2 [Brachypodium distachyon]